MPISIDNLINVNFTKGRTDLLKFGLMLGGKGQHKPYIFTPADLFFLGEKGAYYSPSDISTLFQDEAGTVPVTADGDPVGLMLDKSPNINIAVIWSPYHLFKNSQMGSWYEPLDKTTLFQEVEGTIPVTADGDPVGLMLDKSPNINIAVIWTPFHLFKNSQLGSWYEATDTSTLFQDEAGTIPVTDDGDPVGRNDDKSGNGRTAMQTISSRRPVYNVDPSRLLYDKVDDALVITVPAGGWIGTMVLATYQGTASYGVSIPAGAYNLGGIYFPGTAIVGAVFRDGEMTAGEKTDTERYFVGNGAAASYGNVVDFTAFWRGHSEITEFPSIDTSSGENFSYAWAYCSLLDSFPLINTSSGTNFSAAWDGCSSLDSFPLINTSSGENFAYAWRNCSSLDSFPLINTSSGTGFSGAWQFCSSLDSFPLIDTSKGENFYAAWYGCSSLDSFPLIVTSKGENFSHAWRNCSSLTSFPANAFDSIKGGDFTNAFLNTNLDQTSINGILVSLVASGIESGTRVFDQSGGSAPSSTGEAAIVTLRSRGWTVTVTVTGGD